ncbi:DUF4870 domain-containing protein [Zhihengliuella salsuginis]|uniref:DUF4870 domain-containing protein n=1 Tax=Zhihengliuella salsuginis TaxID=578222 RepID=A0ABQ3GDD2_9MICC|nr:DUF4870 domain-containing protein [Zhihengliuella salsuginis]GHD02086.1 hypothetical protein GCM10008096_06980 [Zhihengliuella salsuginis]
MNERMKDPQPHPDAPFEGSSPAAEPLTPSQDRQWATMAHFGAILGCVPSAIIYYVYRDRGAFTEQEAKEAFNFTLPLTVIAIVCNLLTLLPFIGGIFAIIAVGIWVFVSVNGVVAGLEANRGRPYRYRINLRLIS